MVHRPHLRLEEVDISHDERLRDMYEDLIPVIAVDGCIVSELTIDGPAIRQAVSDGSV